jgi:hypothetical protein
MRAPVKIRHLPPRVPGRLRARCARAGVTRVRGVPPAPAVLMRAAAPLTL